jgi:hypothetical protein
MRRSLRKLRGNTSEGEEELSMEISEKDSSMDLSELLLDDDKPKKRSKFPKKLPIPTDFDDWQTLTKHDDIFYLPQVKICFFRDFRRRRKFLILNFQIGDVAYYSIQGHLQFREHCRRKYQEISKRHSKESRLEPSEEISRATFRIFKEDPIHEVFLENFDEQPIPGIFPVRILEISTEICAPHFLKLRVVSLSRRFHPHTEFPLNFLPFSDFAEFLIPAPKVQSTLRKVYRPGIRFSMKFDGEPSYGTIIEVSEKDSKNFPNSPWESLKIEW